MRGLGAFQMAQMKHKDARVLEFYRHVRSAIDVLELIALDPYQPPEKPTPEPAVTFAPPPPRPAPATIEAPPPKLFYGLRETAALLSISRTTLYRHVCEGRITTVKLGNRTLIPAEALRQWIESLAPA